jgi:hypothetical protein
LQGNVYDFLLLGTQPPDGARAFPATTVAVGYGLMAAAFFAFGVYSRSQSQLPRVSH